MSREDHVRIAELVNRNGADLACFVEAPGMHHSLYFFDSLQQGFDDFSSVIWDPGVVDLVLEWLEEVTAEGEAGPDHTEDGDGNLDPYRHRWPPPAAQRVRIVVGVDSSSNVATGALCCA